MQLKKIQHYIDLYRSFLETPAAEERMHLWASQRHFQEHWDVDAANFVSMYDQALQNPQTRRFWKREQYEPKRLMMVFGAMEPEYARHIFKDLFKEEKDIENRVDRFAYYCDDLLRTFKEHNPTSVENHHYHDAAMISLYLAFRYPAVYAYYDGSAFAHMMQLLGATDIPKTDDLGRYFKTMRTLYGFLQKDPRIVALHHKRLNPLIHYMEDSLLLAWDFALFCTA